MARVYVQSNDPEENAKSLKAEEEYLDPSLVRQASPEYHQAKPAPDDEDSDVEPPANVVEVKEPAKKPVTAKEPAKRAASPAAASPSSSASSKTTK